MVAGLSLRMDGLSIYCAVLFEVIAMQEQASWKLYEDCRCLLRLRIQLKQRGFWNASAGIGQPIPRPRIRF